MKDKIFHYGEQHGHIYSRRGTLTDNDGAMQPWRNDEIPKDGEQHGNAYCRPETLTGISGSDAARKERSGSLRMAVDMIMHIITGETPPTSVRAMRPWRKGRGS